jgi:hypothetical protein
VLLSCWSRFLAKFVSIALGLCTELVAVQSSRWGTPVRFARVCLPVSSVRASVVSQLRSSPSLVFLCCSLPGVRLAWASRFGAALDSLRVPACTGFFQALFFLLGLISGCLRSVFHSCLLLFTKRSMKCLQDNIKLYRSFS